MWLGDFNFHRNPSESGTSLELKEEILIFHHCSRAGNRLKVFSISVVSLLFDRIKQRSFCSEMDHGTLRNNLMNSSGQSPSKQVLYWYLIPNNEQFQLNSEGLGIQIIFNNESLHKEIKNEWHLTITPLTFNTQLMGFKNKSK